MGRFEPSLSTHFSELAGPGRMQPHVEHTDAYRLFQEIRNQGKAQDLDGIIQDRSLASALGLLEEDRHSSRKLAARLVELGWMGSELPPGHAISWGGGISKYVDPEVVGAERALLNLRDWFAKEKEQGKFGTLDDLPRLYALAKPLGLPHTDTNSRARIAAKLVELEWMGSEIPNKHPLSCRGHITNYVDPEVVGAERALSNLKKWFDGEREGGKVRTLDDVGIDVGFASALRIPLADRQKTKKLAAELVRLAWMGNDLPKDHDISRRSCLSMYVEAEVVGAEKARCNLRVWFDRQKQAGKFKTLDDMGKHSSAFASALGLSKEQRKSRGALAAKLVEAGWMESDIPDGHSINRGGGRSNYVNPGVVGTEKALSNLRAWFDSQRKCGEFATLDDVTQDAGLAARLCLPKEARMSPSKLAAKLIELGFMESVLPEGHAISSRGLGISNYVNAEVVGTETALSNLRSWFDRERSHGRFGTLDEVTKDPGFASALGLALADRQSPRKLAAKLVKLGWMDSEIPEGYCIGWKGAISNYVDPEVVGAICANENLRRWTQERITSLEDVSVQTVQIGALCSALGLRRGVFELRLKLENLGWILPTGTDYGDTQLPKEFSARVSEARAKQATSDRARTLAKERTLGVEQIRVPKLEINFAKGEAFEQLVGLYLGFTYPNEKLWGQYCLDVDRESGFFGVRADWKIGNRIVEVKWGGAAANIEETYHRHTSLISPKTPYEIIVLQKNGVLNVPITAFHSLAHKESEFGKAATLLESLAAEAPSEQLLRRLRLFRDAFYSLNVILNTVSGAEREAKVVALLTSALEAKDSLEAALAPFATRTFPTLAAIFEHEGKVYRGTISIPAYQKETGRFQLIWRLGEDLYFTHAEDRDLALILECTDEFYRERFTAYDSLKINREDGKRHTFERPVFSLPSGKTLSLHDGSANIRIASTGQITEHLAIDPELLSFAQAYIAECGCSA